MKKSLALSLCALIIVLPLCLAAPVLAGPPGLPSSFYGTVRIQGVIPAGSIVRAYVHGVSCGQVQVQQNPAMGMVYSLSVLADDLETSPIEGGRSGDVVTFKLELAGGGLYNMMQTGTWRQGEPTMVNLSPYALLILPVILR